MMRRLRSPRALLLLVLVVVGGGFMARTVIGLHVEKVTGRRPAEVPSCLSCHWSRGRLYRPVDGPAYPSPRALAVTADGGTLWVACQGTDEVLELDLARNAVLRRVPVGHEPHALALSPDGTRLYLALAGEDRVASLDTVRGVLEGQVDVGRRPTALALTPDGATLVVANSGSGDVSLLATDGLLERRRLLSGREPFAVAIDADGRRAFVSSRLSERHAPRAVPSSELTEIDLPSGRVVARHELTSAHLSEGVALGPGGDTVLVPLVRVRNLLPITQVARGWVMSSALGVLDRATGALRQLPLDEPEAFFADPSTIVVDAARGRAWVASGGGDCVSVIDLAPLLDTAAACEGPGPGRWADHLGVSERWVAGRIPVGSNPRALALSPDGSRLFVGERLDDAVAIIDTRSHEVLGRIDLGGPDLPTLVRRGERVFHSAAITFQGQFSCRSCHPDGHVDGLTYDFAIDGLGRNLLDNRSLLGVAGTAPFKWNGKNKDLHEQCGPRFAKVLTMADPFAPEDLDALVAFIESLPPARRPRPTDPAAVERGSLLFARTVDNDGHEIPPDRRCSTCHALPLTTTRLPSSVVTAAASDSGDSFDTPHLLGIADSAPYLHDGRAATLEEIWTVHSPQDTHGRVNDLSKIQLNDLLTYVRTL